MDIENCSFLFVFAVVLPSGVHNLPVILVIWNLFIDNLSDLLELFIRHGVFSAVDLKVIGLDNDSECVDHF